MTFPLVPLPPDVVALWPELAWIHPFLGNEIASIAIIAGFVLLMMAVILYGKAASIAQMDHAQMWIREFLVVILAGVVLLATGAIVVVPLFLVCALVALVRGIRIALRS